MEKHKIPFKKLSANSPDHTPVEMVIGCVKEACKGLFLRTKEEIVAAYEKAWDEFPMEKYDDMVARLPQVMRQTIKEKGGNRHT